MKNLLSKAALAVALGTGMVGAQALVLDFDDLPLPLPPANPVAFFLSDYVKDGIAFTFGSNNIATQDWFYTAVVDTYNLPFSGTWVGTSCNAPFIPCGQSVARDSQPISSTTPFVLNSVYLSGSDPILDVGGNLRPQTLTFKLYETIADTTPVATQAFTLPTDGIAMQYVFSHTGFIQKFVVNGVQAYYAMDQIQVTPIPEPGTYALMALGLAAVGVAARRRKA